MQSKIISATLIAAGLLFTSVSLSSLVSLSAVSGEVGRPVVGKAAPAFAAMDMYGKRVSLKDYLGKTVVLEWTNHGCPYVRKHYGSGNMQKTQAALTAEGVVWLSVISSAPGEQGHVSGQEAQKLTASRGAYPTTVLLDPGGDVGYAYGARTTPHMFIINSEGVIEYMGAIDDKPSTELDTIEGAHNYVLAAWQEIKTGRPVTKSVTKPYGCSVKYSYEGF